MAADARLRSSALLALTKLMAVDAGFCAANLRLIFTLLQSKCGAHSVGLSISDTGTLPPVTPLPLLGCELQDASNSTFGHQEKAAHI